MGAVESSNAGGDGAHGGPQVAGHNPLGLRESTGDLRESSSSCAPPKGKRPKVLDFRSSVELSRGGSPMDLDEQPPAFPRSNAFPVQFISGAPAPPSSSTYGQFTASAVTNGPSMLQLCTDPAAAQAQVQMLQDQMRAVAAAASEKQHHMHLLQRSNAVPSMTMGSHVADSSAPSAMQVDGPVATPPRAPEHQQRCKRLRRGHGVMSSGFSATSTSTTPMSAMRAKRRQTPDTEARKQFSDLVKVYKVDKHVLGRGHYGVVRRGRHRVTGQQVAIKSIPKHKIKRIEQVRREVAIMNKLQHPNIIKFYDSFEDRRYVHLVLELCTGGELFERVVDPKIVLTEADVARLVKKILLAVEYCHSNHVAHRDLKPENFLFTSHDADAELKVIDFGLSKFFASSSSSASDDKDDEAVTSADLDEVVGEKKDDKTEGEDEGEVNDDDDDDGAKFETMKTRVGTAYYIAPEVLDRCYDEKCDLWSIGVVCYILLVGYPPFFGASDAAVMQSVKKGVYSLDGPAWVNISSKAKDFIRGLLQVKPEERLTASQALDHDWILSFTASSSCSSSSSSSPTPSASPVGPHSPSVSPSEEIEKALAIKVPDACPPSPAQSASQPPHPLSPASVARPLAFRPGGIATAEPVVAGMGTGGHGHVRIVSSDVMRRFACFTTQHPFKKLVLGTLAASLSAKEVEPELAALFHRLDVDKNGLVPLGALQAAMAPTTAGEHEAAQKNARAVDLNQDGFMSWAEFRAATIREDEYLREDVIFSTFAAFDLASTGFISVANLETTLRDKGWNDHYDAQRLLEGVDLNADGRVDYYEFLTLMQSGIEPTTTC